MSRKRALKKQQKRQESALAQLEVTGRELRQSLACADLDRVERLLRPLRQAGQLRPLALLAEAVLDLAAGRLEAARSRLAALAGMEAAGEEIPPGLLASLQTLACDDPLRLSTGRAPEDAYVQAVGGFLGTLRELEARGFDASGSECLARSLAALRAAAPAKDRELGSFLDSAGRCLPLLADLPALEDRLADLPEGEPAAGSRTVAGWLRGPGSALPALLAASGPPPLLAPLRQAVHLQWRAVLERVAQREGPAGLAALCTVEPRLLAHDVDLPSGSLAALRQTAEAKQLLAAGRHGSLARLLRSRSRSGSDSEGDLAALWALELWALKKRDEEEEDDGAEGSSPHRTLVRLEEMAGEIRRRFPAEQRAAVARWLRGELIDLCEQTLLCEHTAGAALSLLEHQPGDLPLFLAGLAGALAAGDSRARRALEARPPAPGALPEEDSALVQRVMSEVAREDPAILPRILDGLKPFFGAESWPAIAALVARQVAACCARFLLRASFELIDEPEVIDEILFQIRRDVGRLRPALSGTPAFAALELLLGVWPVGPSAAEERLALFLAGSPALEDRVTAFQVLRRAMSPATPPGFDAALTGLAHAVIDEAEDRWQLWGTDALFLAFVSDKTHRQHLKKKIRKLLASSGLPAEGRELLEQALQAVEQLESLRRAREHSRRRRGRLPRLPALAG